MRPLHNYNYGRVALSPDSIQIFSVASEKRGLLLQYIGGQVVRSCILDYYSTDIIKLHDCTCVQSYYQEYIMYSWYYDNVTLCYMPQGHNLVSYLRYYIQIPQAL